MEEVCGTTIHTFWEAIITIAGSLLFFSSSAYIVVSPQIEGRMKSLEVVAVSWYPFGFPKVVYTPSFCRTGRLFSLTSYFLTTRFVAKGLHIHRAYQSLERRTRNRCIQGIGKQIHELIRSWESSGVRFNLKGSTRRQGEEKNNGVVSIFTEMMLGSTMIRR